MLARKREEHQISQSRLIKAVAFLMKKLLNFSSHLKSCQRHILSQYTRLITRSLMTKALSGKRVLDQNLKELVWAEQTLKL